MRAVLFDFNGTLFFDADINYTAWKTIVAEMCGPAFDFDPIYSRCRSIRNELFISALYEMCGREKDNGEIEAWSRRKEMLYRELCRKLGRDQMSPGAEQLLDRLKADGVPVNLCTASISENVDFYFSHLHLDRWFDRELTAYDDGSFRDKSDMYEACAARIGQAIKDCIIIEDAAASIRQAAAAGCRRIIAIRKEDTPDIPQVIQKVDDLSEADYSLITG